MQQCGGLHDAPKSGSAEGRPTQHTARAAGAPERARLPRLEIVGVVATVVVWATLHPFGKLTLADITAAQLPFARVILAAATLLAICAATARLPRVLALFRPRELWKVAVLGWAGYSLSIGLSMMALGHLPAGVSAVLANTSPLMVALGVAAIGRRRLARRTIVGLVLGFAGVVAIASRGGLDADGLSIVGVLLSLGGSATWALYTALARSLSTGKDLLSMSAAMCVVGAVPLTGVVVAEGELARFVAASARTYVLLAWCGIVATALTFTIWVLLLRRIEAARVASVQYLIPACAMLLAYPIAGEMPTPAGLIGAAVIVVGVAMASSGRSAEPARRNAEAES